MHIKLIFALKLMLFCAPITQAFAATDLQHLGSAERVKHFKRFQAAMPSEGRPSMNANDSSIRQWMRDRHPLYRAHGAEHIIELFDIFFRRQGAFQRPEAMNWLRDRLVVEWTKAVSKPLTPSAREALRMYSDVALIFSAAPLTRRLARPWTVLADWSKSHRAIDVVEYRAWDNQVLKDFINDVAERVPGAPVDKIERARWFFTPYHPPCFEAFGIE